MSEIIDLVPIKVDTVKSFYVYYNEWNGEILRVSRTIDNSTDVFLESTDEVAKKILKGLVNERDYIVAFVDSENLGIIKRDEKLRLRSSEKTLHQISKTPTIDWDIRAKIYTVNSKLLLEINPASIAKLTKLTFKKELHISHESDLTLYITKHNKPDFFIEKIDVDPVELLDKGNILYDISNIVQFTSLNEIGLLTRRCFKNYHMEIINDSLNVLQNSLIKNRSFIQDKAFRNFPHPHISINMQDGNLVITKMVNNTELEDRGLLEPFINLHFVGSQPDEYYGSLKVDVLKLKQDNEVQIPLGNINLTELNVMHNKHRIIFSIKDQPDNE